MKYDEIRMMPTVQAGTHESVTRSFHILAKVKELLALNTEPKIVLELINMMEEDIEAPIRKMIIGPELSAGQRVRHMQYPMDEGTVDVTLVNGFSNLYHVTWDTGSHGNYWRAYLERIK